MAFPIVKGVQWVGWVETGDWGKGDKKEEAPWANSWKSNSAAEEGGGVKEI